MREPDRAAVDAALEEAARAEGLLHPEWLPRLVDRAAIRYNAEGQPVNVREVARQFRRENPILLDTTTGGLPRGIDDRTAHGVEHGAAGRERRPDGTFSPSMNDLIKAALQPDEPDERFVRMVASPDPEPPAGGAS